MKTYVEFFIVFYFSTTTYTFIDAESSDLYLVKKNNKVWCAARGETAYSALSWSTSTITDVYKEDFSGWNSTRGCSLVLDKSKCQFWSGWSLKNSLSAHMPPVLDYRWNDFKLIFTDGSGHFYEENNIPLEYQDNVLEVTLSVSAVSDAYILLCEGTDPNEKSSNCYWIILGGWSGNKMRGSAIRHCPDGVLKPGKECSETRVEAIDKVVKGGTWTHVTIRLSKAVNLSLEVYARHRRILHWEDPEPFDVGYLNVRSNAAEAYFRVHKYDYLIGKENDELMSNYFEPVSDKQCWSIIYSFASLSSENASLILELEYEDSENKQIVKTLTETKGEWQHEKIIFQIAKPGRLKLIIRGRGNTTFAVGGIQQCSENGDTRISKAVSSLSSSKLSCQALKYPNKDVTLIDQLSKEYGDCEEDCTINCKNFGIPEFENGTTCFMTSLCKNIGGKRVCFCSSGYTSDNCNLVCENSYGVNCKYSCGNCNSTCSHENGSCSNGCKDWYRPPLCKDGYLILKKGPELFNVTVSSVSVHIGDPSTNGEGIPATYMLQYVLASQRDQLDMWKTEGIYNFNSFQIHNISELNSSTEYAFRAIVIDGNNESYDGKGVPYNVYTTGCIFAEAVEVEVTSTNISVSWKVGQFGCPVKNYKLSIEKDGSLVASDTRGTLPFYVTTLKPFTNYTWNLLHKNVSVESGIKETLQDVPSGVRSITVDSVTRTSLNIKWEVPVNPNGRIDHYSVVYEHCGYLECPDENCSMSKEQNTASTSLELQDLEAYSKYRVYVKAHTIGYGEVEVETGNTSGYGILQVKPEFIQSSPKVKERVVEFLWTLNCEDVRGQIKGFDVILEGMSKWVKDYLNESFVKERSATFDSLHPFSDYRVSIGVQGNDGPSGDEYALVRDFKTKPDKPGKVRNAVAYAWGDSWICLRWEEPYPPTGELEHYEIQIIDKEPTSRIVKPQEYCSFWKEKICVKLENLERDEHHSIKVSARNKDVPELGESELLKVTTKEGVPDPPLEVTATSVSAQEIQLTWKHPDITRGKITAFEANVTLISTDLSREITSHKKEKLEVNEDKPEYSLKINNLYPASVYRIELYGITVAHGENKTVYCETVVSAPEIDSQLRIVSDSVTMSTFQIVIPNDKFMTKTSAYILIVTSQSKVEDNQRAFSFHDNSVKKNVLQQAEISSEEKSWIAAEIKPGIIKKFVIGDNKTRSGMQFVRDARNRALEPGSLYTVTLVAVNAWRGVHRYRAVKLEKAVQTLTDSGESYATAWILAVLLVLCVSLFVFWFIRRRKTFGMPVNNSLELKADDAAIVLDSPSVLESDSCESKLPPSQRFSQRVAIVDLEQYVKTGLLSGELQRQHELFPRGQTRPWDYGKLPENKKKNRYGNLVAYDETRVKLKKLPGDQFSDYINANYINGYNSPRFYIATQGPKPNTVVDFWRMIWQEHVHLIVILANIIEDTKVKCEKYWPEFGQEVTHGAVTIMNTSNQVFADYTFRQLNVSFKGKTRKVNHLHFTSWPDHGVPMYSQSLSSFHKKLLATSPGSGPITVHCSAGVGRTGTVILSDICLRMAAAEGYVDMLSFLQQIREQRPNMVDNLDQYKLVHLVLLECLVTEPSSYPCDSSFENRVRELSDAGTIQKQFNHLYDLRWQDEALRPAVGEIFLSPSYDCKSKNRNLDFVPGPNGRVYISSYPYDDPNSDYINAVYVDGFRIKDQFIVTQFPLESTVPDFWRLIAEEKVQLIVVLNEFDDEDESVCQFWPDEISESMNPVPHIRITKKQEHNSTYWRIYDITITTSTEEEEGTRTVHILHLKDWRSDVKLPPSTTVILELWHEAERLYSGSEPIAVCCVDGVTACGYFVALAFLIEKIKLEQLCDVCQAVRTVRQNREQFIQNCDQFEYLYKGAVTYLSTFQIYANFN